jgi:hypothetical protein
MKLFHSTTKINAGPIVDSGFIDGDFRGIASGVFFSDRPLDQGDDVAAFAEVTFEVDFGGLDLGEYEVIEEGRPDEAYREWLIPADIVNGLSRRLLEDEERY